MNGHLVPSKRAVKAEVSQEGRRYLRPYLHPAAPASMDGRLSCQLEGNHRGLHGVSIVMFLKQLERGNDGLAGNGRAQFAKHIHNTGQHSTVLRGKGRCLPGNSAHLLLVLPTTPDALSCPPYREGGGCYELFANSLWTARNLTTWT